MNSRSEILDDQGQPISEFDSDSENDMSQINPSMLSSMSSTASGTYTYNKIIQDFKKALGERKTPRILIYLNRILLLLFILVITLASFDYVTFMNHLDHSINSNFQILTVQKRLLLYISLHSNFRSMVNVANGIEFNTYSINSTQPTDRFEFLRSLIQEDAEQLQET